MIQRFRFLRGLAFTLCFFVCSPLVHAQQLPDLSNDTGQIVVHVDTNALLLPVVVRDGSGHAIGTLGKDDFKVFDQGKQQTVSGFSLVASGKKMASGSAMAGSSGGAGSADAQQQFVVFLFDDRHFSLSDLAQAQKAAMAMLADVLSPQVTAVVLSFTGVNSGTTHDPVPLKAAIMKLRVRDRDLARSTQCPDIDYYLADQIENAHSSIAFETALQKTDNCASLQRGMGSNSQDLKTGESLVRTAASQALQAGDQDARESLTYLRDVIHTMSKFQGRRSLVLISPGFLSTSGDSMNLKSQILDVANGSSVTVNAIDVRGLDANQMSASINGSGSYNAMVTGQNSNDQRDARKASQELMAELADGTGGTFIHNDNDLAAGFKKLIAPPEFLYLLEVSLKNVKPNGTYHVLQVKLNQPGLSVQTRKGYFAPKAVSVKH